MSQKSRLSWRVNEIVIVSVVAAACAVIFWIWDIAVDPATKTLFAAVPEYRPIVAGMWLLAGVLGGYLIRKPGAALYCEIVAAVISVFLTGGAWSQSILIAGFFQGIGAEIAFAVFGYRVWNLSTAAFAGALSGLFMGVNEIIIYYPDMEIFKAVIYVVCAVVSGIVLAGVLSWGLTKALANTGVLASLASGVQARTARG